MFRSTGKINIEEAHQMCSTWQSRKALLSSPDYVLSPLRKKYRRERESLPPSCPTPTVAEKGSASARCLSFQDLCPFLAVSPSTSTAQLGDLGKMLLLSGSQCLLLWGIVHPPKPACSLSGQLRLLESSAGLCLLFLHFIMATQRSFWWISHVTPLFSGLSLQSHIDDSPQPHLAVYKVDLAQFLKASSVDDKGKV